MSFVVAIDGKAGTGKGTVTKEIAKKLKFVTIDTGAMYRCATLKALEEGISENDTDKIENMMDSIVIEMKQMNGE